MKKKIINFIKSIFVYFSILIYCGYFFNNDSYNILITLLFFFICWHFDNYSIKNNKISKKEKKLSVVLSTIIILCLTFGNIGMNVYSNKEA